MFFFFFFFLMIRLPPRSTPLYSSAASDVYKRQVLSSCLHDILEFGLCLIRFSRSVASCRVSAPAKPNDPGYAFQSGPRPCARDERAAALRCYDYRMRLEKRSLAMRIRFLAPLLLLPVLAQAQMYRWIDDSGKVHYSDRIPLSGAKNVQKQSMPAAQAASASLPYALQQSVKSFPVTLYTSEICKETCARVRELLDKRGVPYSEVTVTDESDLAQLKKLSGDVAVPVLTVGSEVHK